MLDRAVSCQVAEGEAAELAKEDVRAEGEEDGEREREMEPFAESGDELGGMDVAPVVWAGGCEEMISGGEGEM